MELLITIVAFILIFGLLIFVHELGHFLVAKRYGIKVEEFAFGLPLLPRIFKIKRGETEYSIYPVPLGGFVRMLGEDGSATKNQRSFAAKSPGIRAKVLVAGVTMNLILAYLLLTAGFFLKMPPVSLCADTYPGATAESTVQVAAISDDGPAAQAGLKAGDHVKTIAGEPVSCAQTVPRVLQQHAREAVPVMIERDGQPQTLSVTPGARDTKRAGKVGISPSDDYARLDYPLWGPPLYAAMETVSIIKTTVGAIGGLFVNLFTHATVSEEISGPVGIAKLTGDVVAAGGIIVLRFIALLSLSLAVFNLLPIPALDGGRLLFVIIERLRGGKPVTPRIENAIHASGFALLILFIAVITYFDLTR